MRRPVVSFVNSAAGPEQFPRDGLPEVVLLGRSNVGKSSLLNALCGGRPARVSATPGRTQLINFFRVDDTFYLTDLPGYGFVRAPRAVRASFEPLITGYLVGRPAVTLCLALVDARHDPSPDDEQLASWLLGQGLRFTVVATKSDKLGSGQLATRLRLLRQRFTAPEHAVLAVSARTNAGIPELWREIRSAVSARPPTGRTDP